MSKSKLAIKIRRLRRDLCKEVEKNNLYEGKVLELSQQLDKAIIQYLKAQMEIEPN